jgi:hypothetical protein
MKEGNIKKILEDLFINKLNNDDFAKEYAKKIMHPFDNMKDYIKYGDLFIKLELKDKQYE